MARQIDHESNGRVERPATVSLLVRGKVTDEACVAEVSGDLIRFQTARGACAIDVTATRGLAPLPPVSAAAEHLWSVTVDVYRTHVLQSEMYAHVALRREATRSLVTTAIAAFGLDEPPSPAEPPEPVSAAIRRARAFIDANLQKPLNVGEIAIAARVSVRGLQYGFDEEFGMSPMSYLRTARLAAAYRNLLDADPLRDSVTHVARRWGFGHLGRFAAAYRDAYGENPRTTLAR